MAPFKKSGGFSRGGDRAGGGFNRGGDRPAFGGKSFSRGNDRGGRDEQQMFTATCAECRKTCEVPFRPNGEKPVFCRDCFASKRGSDRGDDRGNSRDFTPRDYDRAPTPPHARPAADPRIDDLKRQVEAMNKKIDTILQKLEGTTTVALPAAAKKSEDTLAKIVKTVAKKAAKKKK